MARTPFTGLEGQAAAGTIGVGVPDAYNRTQADPGAFGGAGGAALQRLGGALEQAGGTGLEIATREQAFANRGAVLDAKNAYQALISDVQHGDPNNPEAGPGFYNLQGNQATGAYGEARGRVQDAWTEARQNLANDAQRQMFDQEVSGLQNGVLSKMAQHNSEQGIAYTKGAQAASVQLGMTAAENAYTSPEMVKQNLDSLLRDQQQLDAMLGKSPAEMQANQAKVTSDTLYRVVLRGTADNPLAGKALLDTYKAQLDPVTYAKLAEHLEPLVDRANIDNIAGALSGLGNGPRGQVAGPVLSTDPSLPRGLRNNNPLNLTYVAGQRGVVGSDGRFGQYGSPEDGVAAAVSQMQLYQSRDKLMTPREIITKWAPPSENKTGDYVKQVAASTGLDPDAPIDMKNPDQAAKLVRGMSAVENGKPLDVGIARRGAAAAGRPVSTALGVDAGDAPQKADPLAAIKPLDVLYAQADAATEGQPLAVREGVRVKLTAIRNQQLAARAGDVAAFHKTFADTLAAQTDGRDVPAVPEDRIRAASHTPEQADEMVEQQRFAQATGQMRTMMQFASPGERAQLLQAAADGTGPINRTLLGPGKDGVVAPQPGAGDTTANYRMRKAVLGAAMQANADLEKKMADDPASYVSAMPSVAPLMQAAQAPNATPEQRAAAIKANLAAQAYMGVPEEKRRALPVNQVAASVHALTHIDPSQADMGAAMAGMAAQYGEAWPDVYGSMVRQGLPPEYQALAIMGPDPGKPDLWTTDRMVFQRALVRRSGKNGMEELRDAAGKVNAREIADGMAGKLSDFRATTVNTINGADQYNRMSAAMETYALQLAYMGESSSSALEKAYQGLLGKKYEFDGNMRVPAGSLDDVRTVARSIVSSLSPEEMPVLSTTSPGLTPEYIQNEVLTAVKTRGMWVPMNDDGGLQLVVRTRDNVPRVITRNGQPIILRFDRLQMYGPDAPGASVAKNGMRGQGGSFLPRAKDRPKDDADDRGPIANWWRGW